LPPHHEHPHKAGAHLLRIPGHGEKLGATPQRDKEFRAPAPVAAAPPRSRARKSVVGEGSHQPPADRASL
jgi:hypothetical protein